MSDITPERLQELLQFSESDIIAAIGEMELHSILTELQRLRQTQARIEQAYFDFAMLTEASK